MAGLVADPLEVGPDEPLPLGAEVDGQIGSPQLELWLGEGGAELVGGADVVGAALVLGGALVVGAVLVGVGVGVAVRVGAELDGALPWVICWVVGSGITGLPLR